MATIGYVTKRDDGRYEGELKTLSVRASIAILPVGDKLSDNQPDFRVMSQGIEIGAGWQRIGQTSGKECLPMTVTLGSVLDRLEQARHTDEQFLFLMPGSCGPCRFGAYRDLHHMILQRLGWGERVKIWSPPFGELTSHSSVGRVIRPPGNSGKRSDE